MSSSLLRGGFHGIVAEPEEMDGTCSWCHVPPEERKGRIPTKSDTRGVFVFKLKLSAENDCLE